MNNDDTGTDHMRCDTDSLFTDNIYYWQYLPKSRNSTVYEVLEWFNKKIQFMDFGN